MLFKSRGRVVRLSRLARGLDALLSRGTRARRAIRGYATVQRFAAVGENFSFDPDGTYTYESIFVGRDVSLGRSPVLVATRSRIVIGDHVMFGPRVTIRGGNHRIDLVGRLMTSVREEEKHATDDPGVIIEDDVWIGGNATILAGVRVGRGAVVGAASVVTRDVPPYSVVAGNPAKQIKMRFSPEDIQKHELLLAEERQL